MFLYVVFLIECLFLGAQGRPAPPPPPPPLDCKVACGCAEGQLVCVELPGPVERPVGCPDVCSCDGDMLVCEGGR